MTQRTPEYWQTRILLGVGFIATVIALALSFEVVTREQMVFVPWPTVLGFTVAMVIALIGLAQGLVGFAWMLRIFRGPRDEPPVWRYRRR